MTEHTALLAVLEGTAAELPDVAVAMDDSGRHTWSRGGIDFAVLTGSTVALRIGATIAEAAVRTPDTSRSERGTDWVTFSPAELDEPALDRVEAWLVASHRRATA